MSIAYFLSLNPYCETPSLDQFFREINKKTEEDDFSEQTGEENDLLSYSRETFIHLEKDDLNQIPPQEIAVFEKVLGISIKSFKQRKSSSISIWEARMINLELGYERIKFNQNNIIRLPVNDKMRDQLYQLSSASEFTNDSLNMGFSRYGIIDQLKSGEKEFISPKEANTINDYYKIPVFDLKSIFDQAMNEKIDSKPIKKRVIVSRMRNRKKPRTDIPSVSHARTTYILPTETEKTKIKKIPTKELIDLEKRFGFPASRILYGQITRLSIWESRLINSKLREKIEINENKIDILTVDDVIQERLTRLALSKKFSFVKVSSSIGANKQLLSHLKTGKKAEIARGYADQLNAIFKEEQAGEVFDSKRILDKAVAEPIDELSKIQISPNQGIQDVQTTGQDTSNEMTSLFTFISTKKRSFSAVTAANQPENPRPRKKTKNNVPPAFDISMAPVLQQENFPTEAQISNPAQFNSSAETGFVTIDFNEWDSFSFDELASANAAQLDNLNSDIVSDANRDSVSSIPLQDYLDDNDSDTLSDSVPNNEFLLSKVSQTEISSNLNEPNVDLITTSSIPNLYTNFYEDGDFGY